jgi:hypothetical protein
MKTIFNLLDDIFYKKPDYILQGDDHFDSYMVQRWISMQNPLYAHFINVIYNKRHGAFSDDQMMYDFLKAIIPKKKMGFAKYIKKETKTEQPKNSSVVEDLARTLQISKREVKTYLELFPDLIKELKDNDPTIKKKVDV